MIENAAAQKMGTVCWTHGYLPSDVPRPIQVGTKGSRLLGGGVPRGVGNQAARYPGVGTCRPTAFTEPTTAYDFGHLAVCNIPRIECGEEGVMLPLAFDMFQV